MIGTLLAGKMPKADDISKCDKNNDYGENDIGGGGDPG